MTALLSAKGLQIRPGVIHAIVELALCAKRPLHDEEFIAMLQPTALSDLASDRGLPDVVPLGLEFCEGLGLLSRDGTMIMPSDASARLEPKNLHRELRALVIAQFGGTVDIGAASGSDLLQAMAWLLAQNVWLTPSGVDEFELLQSRQRRSSEDLQFFNNTKEPALREWGVYLGMLTIDPVVVSARRKLLIDPTQTVRLATAAILGAEMPVAEYLEGLASRMCVLDGGSARRHVLNQIDASDLPWELNDGEISPTLSLALYRLERGGYLTLTSKADTPAPERRRMVMDRAGSGRTVDRVSPGTRLRQEVR